MLCTACLSETISCRFHKLLVIVQHAKISWLLRGFLQTVFLSLLPRYVRASVNFCRELESLLPCLQSALPEAHGFCPTHSQLK